MCLLFSICVRLCWHFVSSICLFCHDTLIGFLRFFLLAIQISKSNMPIIFWTEMCTESLVWTLACCSTLCVAGWQRIVCCCLSRSHKFVCTGFQWCSYQGFCLQRRMNWIQWVVSSHWDAPIPTLWLLTVISTTNYNALMCERLLKLHTSFHAGVEL